MAVTEARKKEGEGLNWWPNLRSSTEEITITPLIHFEILAVTAILSMDFIVSLNSYMIMLYYIITLFTYSPID